MKLFLPFGHVLKETHVFDSDYYEIQLTESQNKKLTGLPRLQWIEQTKKDKKTGRKYISLRPLTIAEFLKRQYGAWKWRVHTEDSGAWLISISYLKQEHANTITTNTAA